MHLEINNKRGERETYRVIQGDEKDDEFVCIDENNINEGIHSPDHVMIR